MPIRKIVRNGFHVRGTDYLEVPTGNTAQRGTPGSNNETGVIRVNSETGLIEWWDALSGKWSDPGAGAAPFTEVVSNNQTTDEPLLPNHIYRRTGDTNSGGYILDKDQWSVGQVSHVITSGDFGPLSTSNEFIGTAGQNIRFNDIPLDSKNPTLLSDSIGWMFKSSTVYTIEYTGNSRFIVNTQSSSDQFDLLDPEKSMTLGTASPDGVTAYVDKLNLIPTQTGWPGSIGSVTLPNPVTTPNGTKLYLIDSENYGSRSNVGIVVLAGTVDGRPPGERVYFQYDGEVIELTCFNNGWHSGRQYSSNRFINTPATSNPKAADANWHRVGVFYNNTITVTVAFAGAWFGTNSLGPTINEPYRVETTSLTEKRPGANITAEDPGRQTITFQESGKTFTRKVHAFSGPGSTNFRSVQPVGAVYKTTADDPLLEIMASPHTTFALEADLPVTIKLVENAGRSVWVKGDILDIVNYSGNTITIDTKGDFTTKIDIQDENGDVDADPVQMAIKGMVRLMHCGTHFRVVFRAYY